MFKLYPWEWLLADEWSQHAINRHEQWIEPLWKVGLSCKALLPFVWQWNKGHPNLLAAEFEGQGVVQFKNGYAKKPIFSREGANVMLSSDNLHVTSTGSYGKEGFVCQELAPLPKFGEMYTCIGAWIVDGKPAGMGIREDFTPITKDTSLFIPHYVSESL
jgi:glutathionylspermidine synthase